MKYLVKPLFSWTDLAIIATFSTVLAPAVGWWAIFGVLPASILSSAVERRFWRVARVTS